THRTHRNRKTRSEKVENNLDKSMNEKLGETNLSFCRPFYCRPFYWAERDAGAQLRTSLPPRRRIHSARAPGRALESKPGSRTSCAPVRADLCLRRRAQAHKTCGSRPGRKLASHARRDRLSRYSFPSTLRVCDPRW